MRNIQYIEQNGVVNGLDFDGRFQVKNYRGIAWRILGWFAEYAQPDGEEDFNYDEPELVPDETRVVAIMVGDDRKHVIDKDDLIPLEEGAYCPSCGQTGCHWH